MKNKLPTYTKGEELFNAITHIVGASFGVIIFILFIFKIINNNYSGFESFSLIIYSISVITLYTISSIYHFLNRNKAKEIFRILDHCTIYFLIAGTYTPICVMGLSKNYQLILLLIVWISFLIGVTMNSINMHNHYVKRISMSLYIISGWSAILFFKSIINNIGVNGFVLILLGGILYSIGVVFYAFGKKKKYAHSIWHIFVLLGTLIQFISIYFYII